MSEKAVVNQLSKIICWTSRNTQDCPFCGQGPCDKKMSDTFIPEAEGVLEYLLDQGLIKKAKLL